MLKGCYATMVVMVVGVAIHDNQPQLRFFVCESFVVVVDGGALL